MDTHSLDTYSSSTDAIFRNPHLVLKHLLGPMNESILSGREIKLKQIEFLFVTHEYPDWDAAASFVLCDYLIRNGTLPPWGEDLAEASNKVDQAKAEMKGNHRRAFLLFYALAAGAGTDPAELFFSFRTFVERIAEHIRPDFLGNPFLEVLPRTDDFEFLEKWESLLSGDYQLFKEDLSEHSEVFDVDLPFRDELENTRASGKGKALAFTKKPRCRLHKYWVRADGRWDVLLVPFYEKGQQRKRWIISVDPCARYSLRRLGFALEREETAVRGDDLRRQGEPRWQDYEYCDNDDPWYDGRNHEYTIVDSLAPARFDPQRYQEGFKATLFRNQDWAKFALFSLPVSRTVRTEGGTEKHFQSCTSFRLPGGKSLLSPEDRVAADRWNDRPELGFWLQLPNSFFRHFAPRRS